MKLTIKALSFLAVVSLLAPVMVSAATIIGPPSDKLPPDLSAYTANDVFNIVNNLVNWVFVIIILLSIIFVIVGAFQFVTGGPEGAAKARQNLIWAAVGIGFALVARATPNIILSIIGQ